MGRTHRMSVLAIPVMVSLLGHPQLAGAQSSLVEACSAEEVRDFLQANTDVFHKPLRANAKKFFGQFEVCEATVIVDFETIGMPDAIYQKRVMVSTRSDGITVGGCLVQEEAYFPTVPVEFCF